MKNNNAMDIAYIALELTRIYVENRPKDNGILNRETVNDAFDYYLTDLLGIENLDKFKEMEQELENITEKYNDLRENMETIIEEKAAYKKDVLKHILDNAKGDMEPYVYQSLIKLVK